MKIGIVFDDTLDSPDGVQQYIKTLARWLIKQGHDVKFLVGESYDTSEFKDRVISLSKNFKLKANDNTLSLPYLPNINKIRKTLKREKFDILHVQMPYSPLLSQIIIALADIPRIGTFHSFSGTNFTTLGFNFISVLQRDSLDSFAHVLTVSTAAKKIAKEHFGIKSEVLPNMIELEAFDNGKKIKKYDDDKLNIFFLGRLVERKGAIFLLKAYRQLCSRIDANSIRLIIGGKGYLKPELEKYIKKYKIKNVVLEGYIPEEKKADYYATCDIAVFPSTGGESFGIVLIEAMAAGKTVIGGDNDGYKTVLRNTGSLLVLNPKDTQLFSEKLEALVLNPGLRKIFEKWGPEEVKKYSVDVVGKRLLELYDDAIHGHISRQNGSKVVRVTTAPVRYVFFVFKGIFDLFARIFGRRIGSSSN